VKGGMGAKWRDGRFSKGFPAKKKTTISTRADNGGEGGGGGGGEAVRPEDKQSLTVAK